MTYAINLNAIPWQATDALIKHDLTQVGTMGYLGVAYFWDFEYKHDLRPMSVAGHRWVHTKLLAEGLDVGGVSQRHEVIIKQATNRFKMAS
jgi:hypothetical protein